MPHPIANAMFVCGLAACSDGNEYRTSLLNMDWHTPGLAHTCMHPLSLRCSSKWCK